MVKKALIIAKKEFKDILSEKLYLFAFAAELVIVLGMIYAALLYTTLASPKAGGAAGIVSVEKPRIAVYGLDKNMTEELKKELTVFSIKELNGSKTPLDLLLSLRSRGIYGVLIKKNSTFIAAIDNTNMLGGYVDATITSAVENEKRKAGKEFLKERLGEPEVITAPIQVVEDYLQSRDRIPDRQPVEFIAIMYGFLIPFILLLPTFLASNMITDSIVGEKEKKTYEMLLISPIEKSDIVLGKSLPVITISMLQSLAWIALLTLKGIAISNVLFIFALLLLLNLIFVGLGILISAVSTTLKESNLSVTIMIILSSIALFAPLNIKSALHKLNPIVLITKFSSNPKIPESELVIFIPLALAAAAVYFASIKLLSKSEVLRL